MSDKAVCDTYPSSVQQSVFSLTVRRRCVFCVFSLTYPVENRQGPLMHLIRRGSSGFGPNRGASSVNLLLPPRILTHDQLNLEGWGLNQPEDQTQTLLLFELTYFTELHGHMA